MTIAVSADQGSGHPQDAFCPNLGKALEQVRPNSMEEGTALDQEPPKVSSWLLCVFGAPKLQYQCVYQYIVLSVSLLVIAIIIIIIIIFISLLLLVLFLLLLSF